jgi:DNA-binding transcriptional ArsR family regulator
MTNNCARLAPLFHALADPTRGAVAARLAEGPATVGTLAAPFDMALPTFLQHLKVLEAGGVIVTEKTGRTRVCRINPAAFGLAEGWLAAQRRKWEAQTDRLQDFLAGGHDLDDGPRPPQEMRDE